jgi:hypothetical protein
MPHRQVKCPILGVAIGCFVIGKHPPAFGLRHICAAVRSSDVLYEVPKLTVSMERRSVQNTGNVCALESEHNLYVSTAYVA